MKRKILLATLLSLLAILVCSSAFAACSYTWTANGVKYTCSGTHEYDKSNSAWHASQTNGDCRYFVYHYDETNDKWGEQTVIHSAHKMEIQYDSVQTTATCSTTGNIRYECAYCEWPEITSGKLANQHPSDKLVTETKSATCVDDGYMKITCTACNTVVSNQVTPAHGKHTTASEPRVEKEPTCTDMGMLVDWCTVCDQTLGKNSDIPALGHIGSMSVKQSPSCLTDGYGVLSCSRCKIVLNSNYVISKLGHLPSTNWQTKTVQPYACCAGEEITYCPRCNTTMSSTAVAATADHSWGDWKWSYLESDTSVLTHVKTCSVCGEKKEERCVGTYSMANNGLHDHVFRCSTCGNPAFHNGVGGKATCTSGPICTKCGLAYDEPLGHRNLYTKTVKEATCTVDGLQKTYCGVCDAEVSSTTLKAPGHDPEEYERVEADCCKAGYYKVRCSVCKVDTAGDAIPPTGHNATGATYDKLVEATCTKEGSYTVYCSKYNTVLSSKTLAKTSHTMEDASYAPTCTMAGWSGSKCSVCGYKDPGTFLDPIDHDFTKHTNVKPATCTTDGSYDLVCRVCGTYATTNPIPAFDHTEGAAQTTKAATCCEAGTSSVYCTVCKELVRTETIAATGNHAKEWRVTKEATCTATGVKTLYCATSGKSLGQTQTIAMKSHTEGAAKTTKAATCCESGTAEVRCTVCNTLIRTETLAATEKHAYEWRVMREATCIQQGKRDLYCANSGKYLGDYEYTAFAPHTEGDPVTVQEPTCCKTGLAEIRCTVCDALIDTVTLAAKGHVGGVEWRVTKEATCTEDGEETKFCLYTGDSMGETRTIPAKGHTEGKPVVVKESTCLVEGLAEVRCTVCNELIRNEIVTAPGHQLSAPITVKEPTCCETGLAEIRCTVCGEVLETKTLDAKGHENIEGKDIEWRVTTEPTCTEDGVETKYCLNTGDSMGETRAIPATGHTEDEPVIVKEPACTVDGLQEIRCAVCNELLRTEMMLAPGHQLSAPITVKEPTCCEAGTAEIRCTVCGEVLETKTLDATGHENIEGKDIEWRVTTEPTCTEDGVETKFCLYTGDNLGETRVVPAKGHTAGEAVTVKEPTCCEAGTAEVRCTVCGELLETKTLDATGHGNEEGKDYEWRVTKEPTCTEDGVETKYCLNTGDSMGETRAIPAKGHSFGEWQPEPGDETMKYRVCLECGYAEYEYIKIPDEDCAHENVETLPGYAPSCEENGYTQHDFCKDCGAPVTLPTVIPATGHQNLAVIPAVPATPDQPGKTEGLYCADCGKVLVNPQDVNYEGELDNLIVNGLVVNPETGAQIGEVKDNVYTDMGGNVVGTFQPDGTLVDPQGNVIGDLEGNRIYDNGGAHVGTIVDSLEDVEDEDSYIDVDGIVINPTTGEVIGEVNDNVYTDNNGNEIGTFQPDGTLVDPQGNVIGDLDGNLIYDNDGNHVGTIVDGIGAEDFIDIDGTVVDPETGAEIGKVEDNVYTDNEGNEIGTFQPDGSLVDPEGNVIGKLEGDYIYDNDGNHVGTIVDGTLIPGHPDFDLSDYLDEYYSHVEDGEKIRPTIEEEKCEIGSTQDVNGEQTLISGAEDYAICPNDNYPLSQWIPTGDGSHVRVCTCDTCDYSETAACIYFEITVNDTLYKICPICGHFGDKQYEHIRKVNVGVDGHLHELICREYEEPFGADAAKVKNYAEDEAVVIADSFTAVKSVKGELMAWGDAQTLYIPMPNPGEVTLVSMDMEGNFENVPFMYFDGRIAFNADDNALYLIIAK